MRRHALFAACLGAACTGATDSRPSGFTSVAAGFFHTCGVLDGTATCWGQDWMGQLGDGVAGENRGTPAPVDGGLRFVVLRGGFQYTCGLTSSGAAYCWGDRDHGSLGNGNPASGTETPPTCPPWLIPPMLTIV